MATETAVCKAKNGTELLEGPQATGRKKKKKKGVTRVAHAATLQLNPAMEGYSQYEKGNHQDRLPEGEEGRRKKKKGLHGSLKQLRCNETQPR
jgi:hypothetical protein